MKTYALLLLSSTLSLSAFAQQDVWKALEDGQKKISPEGGSTPSSGGSGPAVVHDSKTNELNNVCEQDKNSSLPLSYISRLFQKSPTSLNFQRDSRSGLIKLTTGGMIDNCSALMEWSIATKTVGDKKVHAVQLSFKRGDSCTVFEGKEKCKYKVTKVKDGKSVDEELSFEPTMSGLEQCLKETDVVTDKGLNPAAMTYKKSLASFTGINDTAEVMIENVGKELRTTEPKFGDDWAIIDGCSRYEQVADGGLTIYSAADEEAQRIQAEKEKVKGCGDYSKIADFIEKYQAYSDDLYPILEKLILQDVKKATAAILKGSPSEDDLKVIEIFDKYVVAPKIGRAISLFDEIAEATTSESKSKNDELKKILGELKTYQKEPYISANLVDKLESLGLFDNAEQVNGLKANLYVHSSLGSKIDGETVTTENSRELVAGYKESYAQTLPGKKQHFNTSSEEYASIASSIREDIKIRNENYSREIGIELACITPPTDQYNNQNCMMKHGQSCDRYCKNSGGRYCYGQFIYNKQRCIEEGQLAIQDMQQEHIHYNKVDQERASEYDALAADKEEIEAQNSDDSSETEDTKKTSPTRRRNPSDDSAYSFNWSGGGASQQQGQQWNPQPSVQPGYNQNMFYQPNYYGYMFGSGNNSMGGVNYNNTTMYPFGNNSMMMGGQMSYMGMNPWQGGGAMYNNPSPWGNMPQASGNYYFNYGAGYR